MRVTWEDPHGYVPDAHCDCGFERDSAPAYQTQWSNRTMQYQWTCPACGRDNDETREDPTESREAERAGDFERDEGW